MNFLRIISAESIISTVPCGVPHLHMHLFPRFEGDPFAGRPIDGSARSFERSLEELERIRRAIVTAADQGRDRAER